MVDPVTSQRWLFRVLFVLLAALMLFVRLLPISGSTGGLPGPDLLFCLGFAWVQRRPDVLTPPLLAAVLLLADLLLGRPPGLWAALGLLGAEFLRSRHQGSGEMPFVLEMAFVAAVVVGTTLAYWALMGLLAVPHTGLGRGLIQAVFTLLAYPVVTGLSALAFRLHPLDPAEADAKGATR